MITIKVASNRLRIETAQFKVQSTKSVRNATLCFYYMPTERGSRVVWTGCGSVIQSENAGGEKVEVVISVEEAGTK